MSLMLVVYSYLLKFLHPLWCCYIILKTFINKVLVLKRTLSENQHLRKKILQHYVVFCGTVHANNVLS